jgi:hypothetical protein
MKRVLVRLFRMCEEAPATDTITCVERDIETRLAQGWTEREIFSELRWIEDFCPEVSEDRALAMMKQAADRAVARLHGDKV